MAIRELRSWEVSCDGRHCGGTRHVVTAEHRPDLPEGWQRGEPRPFGNGPTATIQPGEVRCGYCLSVERALAAHTPESSTPRSPEE